MLRLHLRCPSQQEPQDSLCPSWSRLQAVVSGLAQSNTPTSEPASPAVLRRTTTMPTQSEMEAMQGPARSSWKRPRQTSKDDSEASPQRITPPRVFALPDFVLGGDRSLPR